MGIKLSKQTTAESYHGSSTGLAETKDNWILLQSAKLNKMKKKVMSRKDLASVTSDTSNTRDPKECMANTSKPIKVMNIDNSALYAYKVNKSKQNPKTKQQKYKRNKRKKGKQSKGSQSNQSKTNSRKGE